MIKHAKQSPSLRSGSVQTGWNCLRVSMQTQRTVRSVPLPCRPGQNADNLRYGIHLWYLKHADTTAHGSSDSIPPQTGESQSTSSSLNTYGIFPLKIKNLERGSEK
jgi:hypothetical protein